VAYFTDLFSPETYEAFGRSQRDISGFRIRQQRAAQRIKPGDKLVAYLTKLSRWCGVLEVQNGPFIESTPIFYPEDDPFVVRFRVKPLIWLSVEKAIPIHEALVWDKLSFTQGQDRSSSSWTGRLRGSLTPLGESDGVLLEALLLEQNSDGQVYPVNGDKYQNLIAHRVHRADKAVMATVPVDDLEESNDRLQPTGERESIRIQALLAEIGAQMGMDIWLPRSDRARVLAEWTSRRKSVLERLPLNYDEITLKTIEQIDVLWLKGRAIKRAFEVEHTTSIYSGILRMADLLALQPNMDIRLNIVAPSSRRDKVFEEIRRPVFSLLDRGPLSESCRYLSYESVQELARSPHLSHMSESVIEEYEEEAGDS
jgi:hypothetical protein